MKRRQQEEERQRQRQHRQLQLRQQKLDEWQKASSILFSDTASSTVSPSSSFSLYDSFFASLLTSRCLSIISSSFQHISLNELIEKKLKIWNLKFDKQDKQGKTNAHQDRNNNNAQLNGAREQQVQGIIKHFEKQMIKLGTDLRYLLSCSYTELPSAAAPSSATSGLILPSSLYFPSLHRFLVHQAAPTVSKHFTAMIDETVASMRNKLTELEKQLLLEMDNHHGWKGEQIQQQVEQVSDSNR